MAETFLATRRVEFRDTDAAGIAHFSAFFFYMESVEHELLRQLELSVLMADEAGPISWPRVSANCDYSSAVKFDDVLDVSLEIGRLGGSSVTYDFKFTCAGRPVATGRVVAVCCRFSNEAPPKAIPIPRHIATKLGAYAT